MWRGLVILLVVVFDFASPMLPGAVSFLDGSLETDAGSYARGVGGRAPVSVPVPRYLATVVAPREPSLPESRITSARPPTPNLVRASHEPRSTAASSSQDDD
jgi:hypothetical protein